MRICIAEQTLTAVLLRWQTARSDVGNPAVRGRRHRIFVALIVRVRERAARRIGFGAALIRALLALSGDGPPTLPRLLEVPALA